MAVKSSKKIENNTPLYALVGAADAAVTNVLELLEQAGDRAEALRSETVPKAVQTRLAETQGRITEAVNDFVAQLEALPQTATSAYSQVQTDLENSYNDLVGRGVQVVQDLRNQPASRKLQAQADSITGRARKQADDVRQQADGVRRQARKTAADTTATARSVAFAGRKDVTRDVADAAARVRKDSSLVERVAEHDERSAAAREGAAELGASKPGPKKSTAQKKTAVKATAAESGTAKETAARATAAKTAGKSNVRKTASARKATAAESGAAKETAARSTAGKAGVRKAAPSTSTASDTTPGATGTTS